MKQQQMPSKATEKKVEPVAAAEVKQEAAAEVKQEAAATPPPPNLKAVAAHQAADWNHHNHFTRAKSCVQFLFHFGLLSKEDHDNLLVQIREQTKDVVTD